MYMSLYIYLYIVHVCIVYDVLYMYMYIVCINCVRTWHLCCCLSMASQLGSLTLSPSN